MALTAVQTPKTGVVAPGTALQATYSPAATAGNLLLMAVNSASFLTGTPSGWTQAAAIDDFCALYLFYKIAAGGETTVGATLAASDRAGIAIMEYSGNTATPLDKTATNKPGGAPSTIASGTTAATTQADELAVACFGSIRVTHPTNTFTTYTNSYAEIAEIAATGGDADALAVATKALSATGTQTSTATLGGGAENHPIGLIATFKAAAGGSTTPVTVSASCASTATVTRQANLIRATTAAATATVVRQAQRILSATSAASAAVVKQAQRIVSASAACTATVASLKVRVVQVSASCASTATRIVQAQRTVSAAAADSAVIVRRPQRTLAASCASTATNTALKVILLTVSATAACTATVSRIAAHVLTLTATAAATAVLARNVRRTLTTSAGDNASVTAQGPGGGGTAPPGQRPTLGVG